MSEENKQIAQELIDAVGGLENISSVAHCATRLRIMVKDKEKIDQNRAEDIDKVKGAYYNAGQYQVIFGTGTVNRIYEQFIALGAPESTKSEQKEETKKQGNKFQQIIRTFGDIFVPIIPVLVATGLFMGLRGLVTQEEILALFGTSPDALSDNFMLYTQVLTDTAFAFLPALVAWSAFRVFGGSPVIGIVLGLMLVNPELPNAYAVGEGEADPLMFLGFIPVVGYQGSVLPAFIAGWLGAKLEKWLRQRVAESLDLILTPFLTLLIMITGALLVIGPIFSAVEAAIMAGTTFVLQLPFGLSGLLVGGLHQIIVITGVHHIFNLFEIQLLADDGMNPFNALITAGIAAQGGAALAVALKTRSKKLKALAFPSSISAFLGITEPAIFGVNLRYIKPFAMALIGGAAGGFFAALFNLEASGMAITVIPGSLLYVYDFVPLMLYVITNVIALGTAFVLTWMFGFSDKMLEEVKTE
ncbi:sucrose-specific PTS transporter subunit IIBC [Salisediminibacterium halotolerans]|uniref:sucrose-specific PTS transporter subunit IIBC n=1 Tax=Salisediminibacterium halotolerans TaxID=517425 RepID=UPI000EB4889F|nr:sucrose-specific PTS transporter subunit IIBC [Salisediminibacterium halotolerans]RLJ73264.1 PTS system sucrose-specific IIB component (Glc family) /PTS system sucrose-specific IIC component (Glc family) [Actinophytocola xinjiangensis]RPE86686.1 PTS system sucrose-specific IIB component (Glc family) /PTS system sucrose-specific IIC component (Glc family) [Salisediminibacterium halotolerans]TWG34061.1 PTS system sucrose-specific IIB component (Glc family) /PTS system sucrose-specific IIC compo